MTLIRIAALLVAAAVAVPARAADGNTTRADRSFELLPIRLPAVEPPSVDEALKGLQRLRLQPGREALDPLTTAHERSPPPED